MARPANCCRTRRRGRKPRLGSPSPTPTEVHSDEMVWQRLSPRPLYASRFGSRHELRPGEGRESPALRDELLERSAFDDPALIEHQYPVCVPDCREAVGDDEGLRPRIAASIAS